jgi:hypothetical protein
MCAVTVVGETRAGGTRSHGTTVPLVTGRVAHDVLHVLPGLPVVTRLLVVCSPSTR